MASRRPSAVPSAAAGKGKDRREFPRLSQHLKVGVHVKQPVLFSSPGRGPAVMEGTLINVSRSGALLSLGEYLAPHAACSIEFYGAAGRICPSLSGARVVRTTRQPGGGYRIGVQFDEALTSVEERRSA